MALRSRPVEQLVVAGAKNLRDSLDTAELLPVASPYTLSLVSPRLIAAGLFYVRHILDYMVRKKNERLSAGFWLFREERCYRDVA